MPVVLLLAAVAILAGVVVVAVGRGGELAVFRSDAPPLRREFVTAADMATFRPPPALFGYSTQATDDALRRIARTVADRDAELALLRSQIAALRGDPRGPGDSREPDRSREPERPREPDDRGHAGGWGQPGGSAEPGGWAEPDVRGEAGDQAEPGAPAEAGGPGAPGGWEEPGEAGSGEAGSGGARP
jgi:hypothetical protein